MSLIDDCMESNPKNLDNNELLVYNVAYLLYTNLETQNKTLTLDQLTKLTAPISECLEDIGCEEDEDEE